MTQPNKHDAPKPTAAHLDELRRRLVISVLVFFTGSVFAFSKIEHIIRFLRAPAASSIDKFSVFSPTEAIMTFFKISFAAGLFIAMPVILFHLWAFVRPAMSARVARNGIALVLFCTFLFFCGGSFGYIFLLPASLDFLLNLGKEQLQFLISLDSYISFSLLMILGCAVAFQMPAVVLVLARAGIITAAQMMRGWKLAVVGILVLSAILTPTPDAVNMFLMAVPLASLYVLSIFLAGVFGRKAIAS
jgi:sec-independent protein translocase protein TatC